MITDMASTGMTLRSRTWATLCCIHDLVRCSPTERIYRLDRLHGRGIITSPRPRCEGSKVHRCCMMRVYAVSSVRRTDRDISIGPWHGELAVCQAYQYHQCDKPRQQPCLRTRRSAATHAITTVPIQTARHTISLQLVTPPPLGVTVSQSLLLDLFAPCMGGESFLGARTLCPFVSGTEV